MGKAFSTLGGQRIEREEESGREGHHKDPTGQGADLGQIIKKEGRAEAQLRKVNGTSKEDFKGHCPSNKEQGES